MFDLSPEVSIGEFTEGLKTAGVKVGSRGGNLFRAVTHRMVSSSDIDEALARIGTVCHSLHRRAKK